MKTNIIEKALIRGYFLKKFRRYPLFLRYGEEKIGQNKIKIGQKGKEVSHMQKSKEKKLNMDKFVRYSEGAQMYHMSVSKFMQVAKDAKACYKLNQMVLVSTEIIDEYMETFRIVDDGFYK